MRDISVIPHGLSLGTVGVREHTLLTDHNPAVKPYIRAWEAQFHKRRLLVARIFFYHTACVLTGRDSLPYLGQTEAERPLRTLPSPLAFCPICPDNSRTHLSLPPPPPPPFPSSPIPIILPPPFSLLLLLLLLLSTSCPPPHSLTVTTQC